MRSTVLSDKAQPYGVSFSGNEFDPGATEALRLLGKNGAGIGWLRVEMRWDRIERSAAKFDLSPYDGFLDIVSEQGFQVVGLFTYGSPLHTSAPATERDYRSLTKYPPDDYTAYSAYVSAVVSRYKDYINTWEVWNEADLPDSWKGTPADYARLVAEASKAIKSADPTAQVMISLGLFGPPERDVDFLPKLLKDANYPPGKKFDIVDVHLYGPKTEALRRLDYARTELAKAGMTGKQIWATEVGYTSDIALQQATSIAYERTYQGGPEAQARWLRDMLPYLVKEGGLQKAFWFTLLDTPRSGGRFVNHGLLNADLSPKPAVEAYKALIAWR